MGFSGPAANYTARSQVPARAALARDAHHKDQGGVITFAAMLALLAGAAHFIHGLAYVSKDNWGAVDASSLLYSNLKFWGWLIVMIGLLQIAVGIALLMGNWVARIAAITWAAISAIGAIALIGSQPFLALAIIALDVAIIRALTDGWGPALPD